jgi:hypothetical protein
MWILLLNQQQLCSKIRKPHECVFWVEISLMVFFAGKPTRQQVEWVSRPRKPWVWYFHSRNTWVVFSVYYMPLIIVFWGIFSSNHRKFNSEIQDPKSGLDVAMTLRRWKQWRDDVMPTGAMTSPQPIIRRSNNTHDIKLLVYVIYHIKLWSKSEFGCYEVSVYSLSYSLHHKPHFDTCYSNLADFAIFGK